MPRLCILCGNAAHNRGDRANLTAQIALLRTRIPDAHITVASDRAKVDQHWYDADAVVPRGLLCSRALLRALCKADVVIWGGGALLADNAGRLLIPSWLLLIAFTRFILRKPVMAWAHGLVLETRMGAALATLALGCADVVTVRDRSSYETLRRLGIRGEMTADPAILIEPHGKERGRSILEQSGVPSDAPLIAVAPTFWQYHHRSADWLPYLHARRLGLRKTRGETESKELVRALAEATDAILERTDATIVLLPRYALAPWPDVGYLHLLRSQSKHPERINIVERDDANPRDYFAMWHHFTGMLSVALHDAIVSAAMGVPTVQITYEQKGVDFAEAMGAPNRAISLTGFLREPCQAADLLLRAMGEKSPSARAEENRLGDIQLRAAANILSLSALMKANKSKQSQQREFSSAPIL